MFISTKVFLGPVKVKIMSPRDGLLPQTSINFQCSLFFIFLFSFLKVYLLTGLRVTLGNAQDTSLVLHSGITPGGADIIFGAEA